MDAPELVFNQILNKEATMARHGEDNMKSLLVLLVGVLLGLTLSLALPVLADQDYTSGVFPRTGLPNEKYDPGDNVQHFKNGQWFFGPSTPVKPFSTQPC